MEPVNREQGRPETGRVGEVYTARQERQAVQTPNMKLSELKNSGHWPTLVTAFLYFDFSFMVWTVLGPLSAHISETLKLTAEQTGFMAAVPSLSGAALRIALGLFCDRLGAKRT